MQSRLTAKPEQNVIAAIRALDLESVKVRVMDAETGEGWTREYADSIESAYKNYLTMLVKYQDEADDIVLSQDVDEFWHAHILQTMKYADDCQRVFGNFLHHNPHIGERTHADVEKRAEMMKKTLRLYQREFGNAQATDAAWAGGIIKADRPAYCEAAVRTDNAAYCEAAVRANKPAYCEAGARSIKAAYCEAAARTDNAAYCEAAVRANKPAYCEAAVRTTKAAYCEAGMRARNAA